MVEAVVLEPAKSIFYGLWQGGEAGQRSKVSLVRQGSQDSSSVSSGWPRYMRIHKFVEARSAY